MSFTLTIPRLPPSGNALRRQFKSHFTYRDLRIAWEKDIWAAAGSSAGAKEIKECAKHLHQRNTLMTVAITEYRPRILDYDNLMSGLKPVLDALKNNSFIVDDSPNHIDLKMPLVVLTRPRREWRTVIEIG